MSDFSCGFGPVEPVRSEGVSEAPARDRWRELGGIMESEASAPRADAMTPNGRTGFDASALSPEAERLAKWCDRLAFEADADGVTVEARDFAAIARLLRSPVASLAPRTPWAVSALPLSCDPAWEIGIVGKGAREWFDTKADAERAVALLNVATMPSSLAPTSLAEIPEDVARIRVREGEHWYVTRRDGQVNVMQCEAQPMVMEQ